MSQTGGVGLQLLTDKGTDEWTRAQRSIAQARGFEEALVERQLQELDESVVGCTAAELARLRGEQVV